VGEESLPTTFSLFLPLGEERRGGAVQSSGQHGCPHRREKGKRRKGRRVQLTGEMKEGREERKAGSGDGLHHACDSKII